MLPENVQAMEDHQIRLPQQFPEQSKVSVEGLFYVIKDNEKELRDCYAEILLFFFFLIFLVLFSRIIFLTTKIRNLKN